MLRRRLGNADDTEGTLEDRCPSRANVGRRQKSQTRLRKDRGAGLGSTLHLALPRLLPFGSVLHTALHLGGAPGAAVRKDHTLEV